MTHKPLIVSDVEVSVYRQEGLFQETDPLPLLLLRLVEHRFHFLHVSWCKSSDVLQDLLITVTCLRQHPQT